MHTPLGNGHHRGHAPGDGDRLGAGLGHEQAKHVIQEKGVLHRLLVDLQFDAGVLEIIGSATLRPADLLGIRPGGDIKLAISMKRPEISPL